MKNKLSKVLITTSLLFVGTLSITGCSFLTDIMNQMNEEDDDKDKDKDKETECEHEFGPNTPVSGSTATCQQKGKVKRKCLLCGKEETITDYLPHTPLHLNEYEHDNAFHYQNCKWCGFQISREEHNFEEEIIVQYDCTKEGECRYSCEKCGFSYVDTHQAEHYYPVHTHIDATCQSDGLETYDACPGCGDIKADYVIPQIDHHYIGEVCEYCQRDCLLDYIDKFDNHGDSESDRIVLESEQEYLSLWNYVTIKNTRKSFTCNYEIPDYSGMKNYIFNTLELITGPNRTHGFGFPNNNDKNGYISGEEIPTYDKVSGTDYTEMLKEEYENPIDEIMLGRGNRSNSFDDFKIYNRQYELTCQNSDDLEYACTHGYKPVVVPGSEAETALNEIKNILRDICNDSMNDIEKLFNMYCWLTKNVQYDDGAVAITDSHTYNFTEVKAWGVEGSIFEHKAICDSISKTFAIFAGMEDIRCIQVSGDSHAWNRVYLDVDNSGTYKWYVVDPTFANASSDGREAANHYEFLYTDAMKEKSDKKTATNYLDCPALEDVNEYKLIHYGTGTPSSSNDLFIENKTELQNYCAYIGNKVKSLHAAGKDVQIEICHSTSYNPSTNNSADLKEAFKTSFNWGMTSYQFTEETFSGYKVLSIRYMAD